MMIGKFFKLNEYYFLLYFLILYYNQLTIYFFNFRKSHPLQFQKEDAVLAKDANKKDDDWFEIYDPRSAINKRKRELNKLNSKTEKEKKIKL